MTLVPRGNFFDIDRVFDHLWAPGPRTETAESSFFAPRVDIKELEDHYEITAELPGVDKDNVHVTLEDGVLSITAEVEKEDKEEQEGRILRQERRTANTCAALHWAVTCRKVTSAPTLKMAC